MSTSSGYGIKYFLHNEAFESLKQQIGGSVWIAVRFHDPYDSRDFNADFRGNIDVELSAMGDGSLAMDFNMIGGTSFPFTRGLAMYRRGYIIAVILLCLSGVQPASITVMAEAPEQERPAGCSETAE